MQRKRTTALYTSAVVRGFVLIHGTRLPDDVADHGDSSCVRQARRGLGCRRWRRPFCGEPSGPNSRAALEL